MHVDEITDKVLGNMFFVKIIRTKNVQVTTAGDILFLHRVADISSVKSCARDAEKQKPWKMGASHKKPALFMMLIRNSGSKI